MLAGSDFGGFHRFGGGPLSGEDFAAVLAWLKEQPANILLDAWMAFLSAPSKCGYARARPVRKSGSVEEDDV